MRDTFTQIYIHAVWATWDRQPIITPEIETAVYAAIRAECARLKADILDIGGVEDHVHILVCLPPTLCVSDLIKQLKGSSSHLVTHKVTGRESFKWQGAYAAFSVSEDAVPAVRAYIRNQKRHHHDADLIAVYEIE